MTVNEFELFNNKKMQIVYDQDVKRVELSVLEFDWVF